MMNVKNPRELQLALVDKKHKLAVKRKIRKEKKRQKIESALESYLFVPHVARLTHLD
jgi:hypothetical protein